MRSPMKIYVATSWRNDYQPGVVGALRNEGFSVYDFREKDAFSWRSVDPNWQAWTPAQYLNGLAHPFAERGYKRDMAALVDCDACVYVLPCGPSASLEMGYARGAGKLCVAHVPELREPDLMVRMAHLVTTELQAVIAFLSSKNAARAT